LILLVFEVFVTTGDNRIAVWDMQEVLAHPAITELPATYAIGE